MKRPLLMSLIIISMSLSSYAGVTPSPSTNFLDQIKAGTWYEKELLENYMSEYGNSCSNFIKFDITNDDYKTVKPVIEYSRFKFSDNILTLTDGVDYKELQNASDVLHSGYDSILLVDQNPMAFESSRYVFEFQDENTLFVYNQKTGGLLNQYKKPSLTQGQTAASFDNDVKKFASECLSNARKPNGFICALPEGIGASENQISKTGDLYVVDDILKIILKTADTDYKESEKGHIIRKLINEGGFCQLTSLRTATNYYYGNGNYHNTADIYQGRYRDLLNPFTVFDTAINQEHIKQHQSKQK